MKIFSFGLVSLIILVGYFLSPVQAQQTEDKKRSWSELCNRIDCEELPLGYKTLELDQTRYYFPFRSGLKVADRSSSMPYFSYPARYQDYSDEGEYLRSFAQDVSRIRMTACCSLLLEHFDLTQGWPRISKNTGAPGGIVFALFPRSEAGREHNPNYHFGEGRDLVPLRFLKDKLESGTYEMLGDHFALLGTGQAYKSRNDARRPLSFVSINPILNGRYVFGTCNASCEFYTLRFSDDPVDALPNVKLGNIWLRLYRPQICEDPKPIQNCDLGVGVFDKLPQMFEQYESLLAALRTHPKDFSK